MDPLAVLYWQQSSAATAIKTPSHHHQIYKAYINNVPPIRCKVPAGLLSAKNAQQTIMSSIVSADALLHLQWTAINNLAVQHQHQHYVGVMGG